MLTALRSNLLTKMSTVRMLGQRYVIFKCLHDVFYLNLENCFSGHTRMDQAKIMDGKLFPEKIDGGFSINSRLENLRISADFHSKGSILSSGLNTHFDLPSRSSYVAPVESPVIQGTSTPVYVNPVAIKNEISDPTTIVEVEMPTQGVNVAKWAVRLLRIKKRKMKVHRRKRLWKRMWTVWKKKFFSREKQREIEFRQKLIEAVRVAKKFDAEKYVDAYLEDTKFEFTPKTYKGRSKPKFIIEELLEQEKITAKRNELNKLNLVSGKPLILEGETVDEFKKRNW